MLRIYLAIMVGGALGSAARVAISFWMVERFGESFPWGTLVVNVTGSFIIGVFFGLTEPEGWVEIPPWVRQFVMFGLLGGFTTFSTFSLQTLHLMHEGQWGLAAANVVGSVLLCLGAVWWGCAWASGWGR